MYLSLGGFLSGGDMFGAGEGVDCPKNSKKVVEMGGEGDKLKSQQF